jgi:hypothetical protein
MEPMPRFRLFVLLFITCCISGPLMAQLRYADSVITFSSQYGSAAWSAARILGAPDTYPRYGDINTSWSPRNKDSGREFIELYFSNPAPVSSIAIYETYNPGAVDTIYVKNPSTKKWEIVWFGTATALKIPVSRIFTVSFPQTTFNVSQVRIAINATAVPGWNEFDAVALMATSGSLNMADLVVSDVQAPFEAWSDQKIDVSWKVKNIGTVSTGASGWKDRIYLSPNFDIDLASVALTVDVQSVMSLTPNQSYAGKASITIPKGLKGNYYLFVFTDQNQMLAEADMSNNLDRSTPLLIHLTPEPDLMVGSLTAPTIAFAGDTISATYSVNNIGTVATHSGNNWNDQFFFSQDTVLIVNKAVATTSVSRNLVLAPDSGYQLTVSIIVPRTISGKYYLYAFADRYNVVYENKIESNNIRRSPLMDIVSVRPDLQVSAITVPPTGASGQKMPLEWTVHNAGAGPTFEALWEDRVFVSKSPTFNQSQSEALGIFSHAGSLAADGSYHMTQFVVLPNGIEGQYYVYVQADCNNDVFERSTASQRVMRSTQPVTISISPWPDIRVTSIAVPATANAGKEMSVTWTVENKGTVPTANVVWSDQIFMCADSTFSAPIHLVYVPHAAGLAAGGRYTQTATVIVPPTISGKAYVYVRCDGGNVVYEYTGASNKLGRSNSISVARYPTIDLAVTALTVPDTVASGDIAAVQWTVNNIGAGKTLSDNWIDGLYMSKYKTTNPDSSVLVKRFAHESALNPATGYARAENVTVPDGLNGLYYWFAVTDDEHKSGDSSYANNVRSTPKAVVVQLFPKPDFTVTSVRMDDSVYAGQPAMVRWTVRNASTGPTRAGEWYDAVYLSASGLVDKNALKLESSVHRGPLAAQASYSDSAAVIIPMALAGSTYVVVAADARNDVKETIETNNSGSTASTLRLAAPSDLVVTSIVAPDSAVPGEMVTVKYTLVNIGVNRAVGIVTDAVYVSADTAWTESDPLLGTVVNTIDILPGGVVTKSVRVRVAAISQDGFAGEAEGELPGITPGSYHIIVRTNIRDNIMESSTENNLTASTTLVHVGVAQLDRNVTKQFFIKKDQSKYFSFTALAGEDISVTIDGSTQHGSNEVFVRYADLPSRGQYDYLYQNPNSLNQQVIVSSSKAGVYYILVRGEDVSGDSVLCSVTARTMLFRIDSVQSSVGGIGGEVTVRINGAKFKPGAFAQLRRAGSPSITDNTHLVVSSTQMIARFATSGMTPGKYDMVVINLTGEETVLSNAMTFEPGDPSQLMLAFAGPTRLRINSTVPIFIVAYNPTNMNVQRALIQFRVRKEMKVWTETDQSLSSSAPGTWSADSLVDENGDRMFSVYLYNLAPKQTKMIRLLVEPTIRGRYVFVADGYVLDRVTFDSLLVVALREAVNQRWISPLTVSATGEILYKGAPVKVKAECPTDDPGFCDGWNHRQRNIDIYTDLGGVVTAGAEASMVMKPGPGSFFKLGKFFSSLMNFFNKFKSTSGYAADGVTSLDPNDLVGPAGVGDEHWVSVSQTLQYTVRFENDPAKANAPAQTVSVSMNLDSTVNANTFRLASFTFAGMTFNDAAGRSYYSQRLDCRDSLGVFVDVVAGVNVDQNKIFWTFKAVDPATGNLPSDPLTGLLPVNDSQHHGEGSVSYTIKPKTTAKTRDIVAPKAQILFDANEPIDTPPLFNTIDAGIPESRMTVLPAQSGSGPIAVSWSGRDDARGSGIRSYSIYVSKNDSAYVPWLTDVADTVSQFTGVLGNRYKFFSLVTDYSGNMEQVKTVAEANVFVTGVGGSDAVTPASYSLDQNFPNPFNPSTTIQFGLKENSSVRLDIYNILGQVVVQMNLGRKNAGMHAMTVDMSRYSSGIYFYRIDARDVKGGRFVAIKKMLMVK